MTGRNVLELAVVASVLAVAMHDLGVEHRFPLRPGNMTSRVTPVLRARGEAIRYRYEHTRLVGIDYPVFSGADVTFSWGGAALRGAPGNLVGRITRVEDESGAEEREYGRLGELVEQTRTLASHTLGRGASSPETYTTRWRYDTWGRLQQMVYPDGEVLTYRYDSGGQVRSARGVKLGEEFPYVTRLEYDRFGQRVFQEAGNGIRTHFEYEPDTRRLAQLEAGEFQRLSYGYDRVGNIVSLENAVPRGTPRDYGGPSTHSYSYDRLYRLTGATGRFQGGRGHDETYTLSVGYDAIHNVTRKTQTHHRHTPGGAAVEQHETTYDWAYTYGSSRPHAPTHVGDRSFRFDANGNQLGWDHDRSGQRRTLVWDEEDRIRSIHDNGRTTEFVYDAEGDRVFKVGAQGETAYVNNFWTVRNRTVGTKHVFVGTTRIASKLSPGEAPIADPDPWMVTLGRWHLHRSDSGRDHAMNTTMNPHYRIGTMMPRGGLAEDNFVYFYHPDHLGSTSYVTDPDGDLYEHVEYFPSGEPFITEQSNTERLPYLFNSKELDQETGLYDFGARQYDPRVGVFLSVDPALGDALERGPPGSESTGRNTEGVPRITTGTEVDLAQHLDNTCGRTPLAACVPSRERTATMYRPVMLSTYAYAEHSPLYYIDPTGENPIANLVVWLITSVGSDRMDDPNSSPPVVVIEDENGRVSVLPPVALGRARVLSKAGGFIQGPYGRVSRSALESAARSRGWERSSGNAGLCSLDARCAVANDGRAARGFLLSRGARLRDHRAAVPRGRFQRSPRPRAFALGKLSAEERSPRPRAFALGKLNAEERSPRPRAFALGKLSAQGATSRAMSALRSPAMNEPLTVACPWCSEAVELWVDPETEGVMVEDCSVCCRPWQVHVTRDADGEPLLSITRAQ